MIRNLSQVWVALLIAALSLLSFFYLPGHTYLTQDTQIYVPLLEHLWNPTALSRDLLISRSHIAFTLYDEYALTLRSLTHLSFATILQSTQVVCRALGIWGVYLIALSFLANRASSLAVAAICALGAEVWGPAVLIVEFEPSPRAFALPLFFLALGCIAHGHFRLAALASTVGFLLHPTSLAPIWLGFFLLRQWKIGLLSLAAGVAILFVSASFAPGMHERSVFFSQVPPALESIQRLRSAYNYVGMWFPAHWPKYLACLLIGGTALWRLRSLCPPALIPFLAGLPLLGLLTVPVSYLLLDCLKWSFIPQVQPARLLLFTVAVPILLAAIAGLRANRPAERILWLALSLLPFVFAPRPKSIPTPALLELSGWAARNTSESAVFLFPDAGKSLQPGVFRALALRAVYVDWKGGGQANFLPEFGLEWWHRYQDVMLHPKTLPEYRALGIDYVVYPGTPFRVIPTSAP